MKKTKFRQESQEINHNISDISDGFVYKALIEKGAFRSVYDISVILNTDGVPVFNSSSYSFWPVHILINELPYKMRCVLTMYVHAYINFLCLRISKENRILGGLWHGKSKPDMLMFLKPIVDSLIQLHSKGT